MALPDPPKGWGDDDITKFLDVSRWNNYATFANLQPEFHRLVSIDSAFRKAIDNLHNSQDWFAALFLARAHSNYLASIRLSMSGQVPETYAVLRSCLENALYGFYISENPGSGETWIKRHDSDQNKKEVRKKFKIRTLLDLLILTDTKEGNAAEYLYEHTIDYGAHPNDSALFQTLQMKEAQDTVEFKILYLDRDSDQFHLALRTVAQVGVNVLGIFRLIYKERFDIIGLTNDLDKLRKGL